MVTTRGGTETPGAPAPTPTPRSSTRKAAGKRELESLETPTQAKRQRKSAPTSSSKKRSTKKASEAAKKKARASTKAANLANAKAHFEAQISESEKAVMAKLQGVWEKMLTRYKIVNADDFLANEDAYKSLVSATKKANRQLDAQKSISAIQVLVHQFEKEGVETAIRKAIDRLRAQAKTEGTDFENVPGHEHVSSVWKAYDIETRLPSGHEAPSL